MSSNKQKRDRKKPANLWGMKSPRDANIGAPDAIDDFFYLENCFIETDVYKEIIDPSSERSLLIGRTGSGKTACIQRIKKNCESSKHMEYVEVDVDGEFFGHLDGLRKIMGNAEKQNLVPLLKVLWMHILIIHLARVLFPSRDDLTSKLKRWVSKKSPERELRDYIRQHEDAVWNGDNPAQIVQTIKNKLSAQLDIGLGNIVGSREEVIETTKENAKNPQDLFGTGHLSQLRRFVKTMCTHIAGENNTYYILIDKLDTEWAPDPVRYMLVRVLTETVQFFYSASRGSSAKKSLDDPYPVKIIVALRRDLLDKVNIEARTAGFQSEKISHFECEIKWSKQELRELVDKRIRRTAKDRGNQSVGFDDVFPQDMVIHGAAKSSKNTLTYIEERTLQRPRDIIEFVNLCFIQLFQERKTQLTASMIKKAEEKYSENRFTSVTEEWTSIYPGLDVYAKFLHEFRGNFKFSEFRGKVKEFLITEKCDDDDCYEGWVMRVEQDEREVAREMLNIFCKTGFIMVKLSPINSYEICSQGISQGQCKPDLQIKIHPMFYAYFSVDDRNID